MKFETELSINDRFYFMLNNKIESGVIYSVITGTAKGKLTFEQYELHLNKGGVYKMDKKGRNWCILDQICYKSKIELINSLE